MSNLTCSFSMDAPQEILKRRHLEEGGMVQIFIDSEVARLCTPYVPWDTGTLAKSPLTATDFGSGEVVYNTPYAKAQYYRKGKRKKTSGMQGPLWFERMKADHKKEILAGAQKYAGASW